MKEKNNCIKRKNHSGKIRNYKRRSAEHLQKRADRNFMPMRFRNYKK